MTKLTRLPLLFFVTTSIVTGVIPNAVLAQEDDKAGGIKEAMSPEQFEASGLNKLTAKELQNLNNWLQGDREAAVKSAEQKSIRTGKVKPNLVVSRIDGTFFGLSGSTIIKLQDGTKWKQANKSDRYQGPGGDNLGVAVFKAGLFGYRMRIEGTPEFYVDQITK